MHGAVSKEEYDEEIDSYVSTQLSYGPVEIRKAWAALLGICETGMSKSDWQEWEDMVKGWIR